MAFRLTGRQISNVRRGDLTDYAVEARDGPVGRLSSASERARDGSIVVELGPLLFGDLVVLPLEAVTSVDPDTGTLFVNLSMREVRQAERFHD